jgi:hypothetical protein
MKRMCSSKKQFSLAVVDELPANGNDKKIHHIMTIPTVTISFLLL